MSASPGGGTSRHDSSASAGPSLPPASSGGRLGPRPSRAGSGVAGLGRGSRRPPPGGRGGHGGRGGRGGPLPGTSGGAPEPGPGGPAPGPGSGGSSGPGSVGASGPGAGISGIVPSTSPVSAYAFSSPSRPPAPPARSPRASAVSRAIIAALCTDGRPVAAMVPVPAPSGYNRTSACSSASRRRSSAPRGSTAITARRSAARSCPGSAGPHRAAPGPLPPAPAHPTGRPSPR